MPYAWRVLIGAFLGQMAALGFGRFTYAAILPGMRDGLRLTNAEGGLVATANLVGYLLGSISVGAAAARWGARRSIAASLVIVAIALAATGLAPSFPVALAAQLVTGAASAGGAILSVGLVTPWFARQHRGIAGGIVVAGAGPGFLIGSASVPAAVLWLASSAADAGIAWRYAWLTLAVLVAGTAVAVALLIRNHPEDVGEAPWGARQTHADSTRRAIADIPRDPDASPRPIWRDPVLLYLGLIYSGFGLAYTSYATFFPATLVHAGWSQVDAARLWGVVGIAATPGSIAWGRISDRIGRTGALAGEFAVMATASLLFAAFSADIPLVSAVLFGASFFATPTIMSAAAGDRVGPTRVYAAFGFLNLGSATGQTIGPTLSGLAIDLTRSFTSAYLFAGAVAVTAAVLAGAMALTQFRRSRTPHSTLSLPLSGCPAGCPAPRAPGAERERRPGTPHSALTPQDSDHD